MRFHSLFSKCIIRNPFHWKWFQWTFNMAILRGAVERGQAMEWIVTIWQLGQNNWYRWCFVAIFWIVFNEPSWYSVNWFWTTIWNLSDCSFIDLTEELHRMFRVEETASTRPWVDGFSTMKSVSVSGWFSHSLFEDCRRETNSIVSW